MKKRLIVMLLALALIGALSACGESGGKTTTETPSGTPDASQPASIQPTESVSGDLKSSLTIALTGDPANFGPNATFSDYARQVVNQIYGRLFKFDNDGNMQYLCATSVEQEDTTHILIKLRTDVKDSNGNQLKASDVLFSINACSKTMFAGLVKHIDVDNSQILDDYTLRLTLPQPYSLQLVNLEGLDLFSEASYNASPDQMITTPVGFGPYMLDSYTSGSQTVLKARDDYFGGQPQFKTVTFVVIVEPSQKTNALISGDVDLVDVIQPSDIEYVEGTSGCDVVVKQTIASNGIVFNCSEVSACNNVDLRRAICYAIDSAAIINTGYKGFAIQPISTYSTALMDNGPEWNTIAAKYDNYYSYNLDKAKEYFEKSGTPQDITLKAIHYTANNGDTCSQMVQAMLSQIGINLLITAYDNATVNDMLKTDLENWDLTFTGWQADAAYSQSIADLQIADNNFCNWSGESFDTFRDIVKQAGSATSQQELLSLSYQIVDMSSEYVPFYSLADISNYIGSHSNINVVLGPRYLFDVFYMTTK